MSELLEKDQVISIVPQDFRNSNKGKVVDIQEQKFKLELLHENEGITPNKVAEFYSQTKEGMLFFASSILEIENNLLTIAIPKKHRFLQRRSFSRVNFAKDLECKIEDKAYKIKSVNLSVGGMKFKANELLDLNTEYDIRIELLNDQNIDCKIELIRVEKNEDKTYTLSGRFKNISNIDKMTLVQFCMRRNIENMNKENG